MLAPVYEYHKFTYQSTSKVMSYQLMLPQSKYYANTKHYTTYSNESRAARHNN